MEKKNLTIQELYDYCKDHGALDYIISIPYERFDVDTDSSYTVSSGDYDRTLTVDINVSDRVIDLSVY